MRFKAILGRLYFSWLVYRRVWFTRLHGQNTKPEDKQNFFSQHILPLKIFWRFFWAILKSVFKKSDLKISWLWRSAGFENLQKIKGKFFKNPFWNAGFL